METLAIILWILLNVLSPSNAITCSGIVQCEYDSLAYANAQVKGDVATQCSLLGKSVECMEAAMDDCERNANFPEKKLQEVQQVLDMHKHQVLEFCPRQDLKPSKVADSQRSWVRASTRAAHGPADVPASPVCADIMSCMFDLAQFKRALQDNRLTEACSLINPSVKCLRHAIKDCKDSRFIDNDDIANATHSLTDAETLLENYCGYTREKENVKTTTDLETSERKQVDGQVRNVTKKESSTHESLQEARTKKNVEGSYDTLNEDKKNGNDDSDDGHNRASVLTVSWPFLFLVLFVNIGGLNFLLFHKVSYTDIISSF